MFPEERLNRETPRAPQEAIRWAAGRSPRSSGTKHLQMQSPQKWLSYFQDRSNVSEFRDFYHPRRDSSKTSHRVGKGNFLLGRFLNSTPRSPRPEQPRGKSSQRSSVRAIHTGSKLHHPSDKSQDCLGLSGGPAESSEELGWRRLGLGKTPLVDE